MIVLTTPALRGGLIGGYWLVSGGGGAFITSVAATAAAGVAAVATEGNFTSWSGVDIDSDKDDEGGVHLPFGDAANSLNESTIPTPTPHSG